MTGPNVEQIVPDVGVGLSFAQGKAADLMKDKDAELTFYVRDLTGTTLYTVELKHGSITTKPKGGAL